MAESFADEIKWWKSRAAEFDAKRAKLQPLSYSYTSQAYAARGNYNGAVALDSMRLAIYKKAEEDRARIFQSIKDAAIVERPKAAAAAKAVPNSVVKPSEGVAKLDSDVDRMVDKLGSIGSSVGRSLVGGLTRALDLLSRTTYTVQNMRMGEVEEAKSADSQGGTDFTLGEHIETAFAPLKIMNPAFMGYSFITDREGTKKSLQDAKEGFFGTKKTTGIDVIRAEYPNWAKEHNVLANVAGFASDVASDPLTYLTMGEGTVLKTGMMGAAKIGGKHELAKALYDSTVWSSTGRAAGKAALGQQIRTAKTGAAAKTAAKADKNASKAGKKLNKAQQSGKAKTDELAELKKQYGAAEGHRIKAVKEYEALHKEIFDAKLRGVADAGRYVVKHPFKAVGTYGQGVRTGGVVQATKAAKAAREAQRVAFVKDAKVESLAHYLRPFHTKNAGKTIKNGSTSIHVAEHYDDFVEELSERLFKFVDISQHTRRAARGRYSVLSQVKKEQNELINLLSKNNGIDYAKLSPWKDDLLGPDSPFARIVAASVAAPAPTGAPDVAAASSITDEAVSATRTVRDILADMDEETINNVLGSIASSLSLQREIFPTLHAARNPDLTRMDDLKRLPEDQIAIRELYKRTADDVFKHYEFEDVSLGLDGRVTNPNSREPGSFAATGQQVPNFTRTQNLRVAEAIYETIAETTRRLAYQNLVNDPEIVVKSVVEATHDILNRVSADTHVQVMEYLHLKHGLSMPSMNLPRAQVDGLFASGQIWEGLDPQHTPKHYSEYLKKQLEEVLGIGYTPYDDNIHWQMLDSLDPYARNPDYDGLMHNKNRINGTMENPGGLLGRLEQAARELHALHYGPDGSKTTNAVDKYTMLDHFVFGQRAAEQLDIDSAHIGRAAFATDSLNTNGIPPYNAELLKDIRELDQYEKDVIAAYERYFKEGFPEGIVPLTPEEIKLHFASYKKRLTAPDIKYVFNGTDMVDPQRMLHSLGAHLDLLSNTRKSPNFSIEWRRRLAANLWGIPAKKIDNAAGEKEWLGGSAAVMADLNEAISFGILHHTVVRRMTPEQVSDWLATLAEKYPNVQKLLADADASSVRQGSVGVQRTAPDIAQGDDIVVPSETPGGFTAPNITPEDRQHIQALLDDLYDQADVVTLTKFMDDTEASLMTQIQMYNARMQNTLQDFQMRQGFQLRIGGIPVVTAPSVRNNPIHTNAGVMAMNENMPKHITARAHTSDSTLGDRLRQGQRKWLSRPTSRLDEGLRQIHNRVSGNSTFKLRETMDHVKATYNSFKNKSELKNATRVFFSDADDIDPRLLEVEKRFNDVHENLMRHAEYFTGKTDLGYQANFVKQSVATVLASMPSRYKVQRDIMNGFSSDMPPFSRQWFLDLATHLNTHASASGKFHTLSGNRLQDLDLAAFEFAFQHTYQKLRARNETAQVMFETFGAKMNPSVVFHHNNQPGIKNSTVYQLVSLEEGVGKRYVPDGLKFHYVPQHLADEMVNLLEYLDSMMDFRQHEMNFGLMASINNYWKAGVTVFSLRYHAGNIMSDSFMNLMSGVRPASYKKAMACLKNDPDFAQTFSDPEFAKGLSQVLEPAADNPVDMKEVQETLEYLNRHGSGAPISRVTVLGKPHSVNSADYYTKYREFGLDNNNVTGNLRRSGVGMVGNVGKVKYTVLDTTQTYSAAREDYFRMSNFIHSFEQEAKVPGRTLDDIWLAARDRVVKYNFDYDNITEFERIRLASWAPFYKWTRNIVPLSLSWLFTNPKAYTIPAAANRSMGEMFFPTQEDDNGNPIPFDTVLPRWIAEQGAVPIETYLDSEGNQQLRYAVLNLPLDQALYKWLSPVLSPWTDPEMATVDKVAKTGTGLGGSAGSMLHPGVAAGTALLTGRVPMTGGSLAEPNWWEPLVNMILGGTGMAYETVKIGQNMTDPKNDYSLEEVLGDLGITRTRSVTDAQKKGELLMQQDRLQAILKKKQSEWLGANYPGVDPMSKEGKKIIHDYYVDKGILQK